VKVDVPIIQQAVAETSRWIAAHTESHVAFEAPSQWRSRSRPFNSSSTTPVSSDHATACLGDAAARSRLLPGPRTPDRAGPSFSSHAARSCACLSKEAP
jgi:hypothetical protein